MLVIYESLTDMNVEIGTEAPQLIFWEYINGIFVAVRWWALISECRSTIVPMAVDRLSSLIYLVCVTHCKKR
jgi:hypothetical protein